MKQYMATPVHGHHLRQAEAWWQTWGARLTFALVLLELALLGCGVLR